jgi:predicted ATPase/class 3 adenylate cyclase
MSDDDGAVVLFRPTQWGEMPVADGGFVLPTGTVSLLLADVEGSTRHWENDPEATGAAIADLNQVVDDLVGRFDGVRPIEQGEGDSFVSAFARARDAVGCALGIQRALARGRLRLRIGVHTGEVQSRGEGNYAGSTVNRAARLRNLAHGGQTVLSQASSDLVADGLPAGASLRDLGFHRLKDLTRPEHVYQLDHADLPAEFPPLRSLDAYAHNLPVQRTTFVGRDWEIAEIKGLLGEAPLVTLTGAGGCGKSRLALHVAADLLDGYPDGVWLVELAPLADPDAVPARMAALFALKEGPGMSMTDTLVAYLAEKRAMIVLDNCEHVIDGAARLADTLLDSCNSLRVLATSRQPLGVDGEIGWRVPSLAVPAEDGPAGIDALGACEAVRLFADRARQARRGFEIDDRTGPAAAEICRRLDGIPLAIELAAARVRVLAPAQIAAGLAERFGLLTGGTRTALPRQQTLEASVGWSHDLLTEPERVVFRRLAVFAGNFSFEAAEEVCTGGTVHAHQVLDLITLLVDKSLVQVDDDSDAARYRLLETVRAYAVVRLTQAGEEAEVRTHHRDHYAALAEEAEPHLEGQGQTEWMAIIAEDYPNLRAALAWSRDHDTSDDHLAFAAALWLFWYTRGPLREGQEWLDQALDVADLGPRVRARGLFARAYLEWASHELATMASRAQEGLLLARQVGDERIAARSLLCLAFVEQNTGPNWDEMYAEVVELARRAGDTYVEADGLGSWAMALLWREPARARINFTRSLQVCEELGIKSLARFAAGGLGFVELVEGDLTTGKATLQAVIAPSEAETDRANLLYFFAFLTVALIGGDDRTGVGSATERLEVLADESGWHLMDPIATKARAAIAVSDGDHAAALQLSSAAVAGAA